MTILDKGEMIDIMKRRILILSLILLLSSYFTITTYSSSTDSEIWLDKVSYSGYGACPLVTLVDNDLNINHNKMDEVNVTAYSTSDAVGISVKLRETKSDSGEFVGDFVVTAAKSNEKLKMLQITNNDTITVIYKETKSWSDNAQWNASTGTVKLGKSSYIGLSYVATVSVSDQDLNLRSEYIDVANVRITSGSDPRGFILTAYESGINTGVFNGSFKFDTDKSDIGSAIIKVKATDNISATYIDEINTDGVSNIVNIATSSFQFSEATIATSADSDEGEGNILAITINEPDANNPKMKDRIIAKASSGSNSDNLTIRLDETGTNTGSFKCSLFLNDEKTSASSLQIAPTDTINIKYIDSTVPQGDTKEIIKTVKWEFISTLLKTDKDIYTGYSNSAKITLTDYNLNKDEEKTEFVEVRARNSSLKGIKLKLKETSANSGEFKGTLYFGKLSKNSEGIIKVENNETITISYTNEKDEDDTAECYIGWSLQDAQISMDRQEYKGDNALVKITLSDWDVADDINEKDEVKVTARLQGGGKDTPVTLTETTRNSGTFTGTLYINGSSGNRPSISLRPTDKFEVIYNDKGTTSGKKEDRIAKAVWGGNSKATLSLDNSVYKGYETYMTINLEDPDQNRSTTTRDRVSVLVSTKSSKTNKEYTLTETGNNTGVFTLSLEFSDEAPATGRIRVTAEDVINVTFKDKGVSATAKFTK
jgi:hypothetical protein